MTESEMHAINNALTVIIGNLELLKDEYDLELVENALRGSKRILEMVENQYEI